MSISAIMGKFSGINTEQGLALATWGPDGMSLSYLGFKFLVIGWTIWRLQRWLVRVGVYDATQTVYERLIIFWHEPNYDTTRWHNK